MNVATISHPLPGEHLAATSPAMRPETDAGFRLRLNFWPGRSLTAEALELEQEHRAGHLAWQGRVPTPGIVAGLDAGLEEPAVFPAGPLAAAGHFLHLAPGHGISAYGEDVQVPRPLRIPLEGIAVHAVRVIPAEGASEAPAAGATSSTPLEFGGVKVEIDTFAADYVPWAAVLVARPAELGVFGKSDPEDPCELDPSRDAFADQRRLDALVLRLIQLPSAWESDPLLADRADPRWRNRLAHYIFARERENAARQSVRFLAGQPAGERWEVVHAGAALFPWELFGVPIALFGAETTAAGDVRFFLDCGAVARPGGLPRARTRPAARLSGGAGRNPLDTPGAGNPVLWRAQVDQFAQHLGSLRDDALADQAARFQFVPPAGLLPRDALDLLTTEEAGTLSAPDRAAGSRFFPEGFAVEAVPIPTEDLDAALAASAPLLPYDFLAPGSDLVRVLVPVAQNLFDPRLLVIETEDPFFATELGRLLWVRQDWRQRRDAIRAQRDRLLDLIDGPRPAGPLPALEAGQIEPEPVEAFSVTSPVRALYLSPADTPGPWELDADLHAFLPAVIGARTTVYVRLRIDLDDPPALVELRLRIDLDDSPAIIGRRTSHGIAIHSWTAPSDAPAELLDADGTALALPLWRLYTVTGADLGITRATITGFTLHVEGGRVGFSDVGTRDSSLRLLPLWNSALAQPVRFKGGDWTLVTESAALSAPFEPSFALTFPDGDLAVRLAELPKTAPEAGVPAQGYQEIGLQRLLDTLERQLRRADDFVDLQFLKTQANTHRIRQVLLGDDVADDLLVSPILSSVVKKSSALVAEQDLAAVLKAAKTEVTVHSVVVPSHVEVETRMEVLPHINFGAFPILKKQNFPLPSAGVAPGPKVSTAADDVLHAQPAVGQVFDLHTLTIAKRFDAGPVRTSFDFTDSALRETIGRLGDFDLEYDASEALPDTTTGPNNSPVPLRDLANGSIKITDLRFEQTAADDASALFARGIRRADATVFVLRRLEFYVARRRALIARGREVLAEARRRITGAGARLQVDDGALAEARQDVAVARALRREEQDRVAGINRRRDDIIRDEVRFLAYVRPRAVDPRVRRTAGWKLDAPEAALAVPACLRRHDEPPDALHAYIQLFNHAPAAWFVEVGPRLKELDTREKLSELLLAAQRSALTFASDQRIAFAQNVVAPAARNTLLSAYSLVEPARVKTAAIQISQSALLAWNELHWLAELHSVLGDIIGGHHGLPILATVGAGLLRQIEQVATCLHAEFAAVPGAIRLVWAERYSEFDKPAPLNDLTVLPGYGQLDREARRRFQAFVDWLFQRVTPGNAAAFGLINNLVRVCLLLASDAPVNKLIAGRLPRPVPVRPGVLIPILPFDPKLVKVGMEFHVWQAETVVARGRVSDLVGSEVSAKVEHVLTAATVTTLDETMRVQFIPAALGILT